MPYFYLIASVFFIASSSIFGSFYNRKNDGKKDPTALYNLLLVISAILGWGVIYAFDFSFNFVSIIYAFIFAACYAVANIGIIKALATGPVSLTSLILQLSLIGVTVWGFFFWDAPFTLTVGIGIALVVIAIFLCLFSPRSEGSDKKPITLKWIIYVSMAFFGNAGCTIAQRTHQMAFDGKHGSMLMLFAMLISAVIFTFVYIRSNRSDTKDILKGSWCFPVIAGVCNVLLNLFVILLASTELSPSIIYPVIGVGGIMISTLFSAFFLKEKLYVWQWCGIAVGAVATVLLSI